MAPFSGALEARINSGGGNDVRQGVLRALRTPEEGRGSEEVEGREGWPERQHGQQLLLVRRELAGDPEEMGWAGPEGVEAESRARALKPLLLSAWG